MLNDQHVIIKRFLGDTNPLGGLHKRVLVHLTSLRVFHTIVIDSPVSKNLKDLIHLSLLISSSHALSRGFKGVMTVMVVAVVAFIRMRVNLIVMMVIVFFNLIVVLLVVVVVTSVVKAASAGAVGGEVDIFEFVSQRIHRFGAVAVAGRALRVLRLIKKLMALSVASSELLLNDGSTRNLHSQLQESLIVFSDVARSRDVEWSRDGVLATIYVHGFAIAVEENHLFGDGESLLFQ
mmetsp:Transcript_600/g.831  ORF Transcript_600/g.831 Transcript_600/m.831 type:complete len:235 (-) Transcript_600:101-805(-)